MVRQAGKSGGFLGECWICSPASHIFTRHRFPPLQISKNLSATWRSHQELHYSFQPVQYKVTYSKDKMALGKLLLEYSFGVWWAHCPAVSAHDGTDRTPELLALPSITSFFLPSPACSLTFSFICVLYARKGSSKSCEIWCLQDASDPYTMALCSGKVSYC